MNSTQKRAPKVLIIGIHGPYEPWMEILTNGQMKTWMSHNSSSRIVNAFGQAINSKSRKIDEKIYYLRWSKSKIIAYGALLLEAGFKKFLPVHKYQPVIIRNQENSPIESWQIQMPDSLLLQGVKNVSVFRKSLEIEYDFLVTTITSSYLNVALLEEVLANVPRSNYLAGRIENSGPMRYQQGSFRVYSRDVVIKLVENFSGYKHWKIEDIAMGDLVANHFQDLCSLSNRTLESFSDVESLTKEDLNSTLSYRCKSTKDGRRIDSQIMNLLHKKLLSGG